MTWLTFTGPLPPELIEHGTPASAPEEPSRSLARVPRRTALIVVALVALLVLIGVTVIAVRAARSGPAPVTQAQVDKAVEDGLASASAAQRDTPPDAVAAYRTILPSLVTITQAGSSASTGASATPESGPSTGASATTGPGGSGGSAPTSPTSPTSTATTSDSALGAGVIINAQGAILTALHVVDGTGVVRVRFADGKVTTAQVTTRQPDKDIAVLTVADLPSVVVPAVMAGGVQVGDAVYPVGHPLGLEDSLTAGVVSALDRNIRVSETQRLTGLIQFDAAVNPGNSGGPLLDRAGHVVGIVTALANPSDQSYFVGIGFAVPIESAGGAAGGPRQ